MRLLIESDHLRVPFSPSWEALQSVLLSALYGESDDERASDSRMVRIKRNDGGSNYRAPGGYTVTLRDGAEVKITFEQ